SSERQLVRAGPARSDLPERGPDAHPPAAARTLGPGPEQGVELSRVIDFDSINRGFSAKALVYDNYGADHPVILWARAQVRGHLMALVPPPAHILELAAGTGANAAFLAEHGYRVHATDLADGMVAE